MFAHHVEDGRVGGEAGPEQRVGLVPSQDDVLMTFAGRLVEDGLRVELFVRRRFCPCQRRAQRGTHVVLVEHPRANAVFGGQFQPGIVVDASFCRRARGIHLEIAVEICVGNLRNRGRRRRARAGRPEQNEQAQPVHGP